MFKKIATFLGGQGRLRGSSGAPNKKEGVITKEGALKVKLKDNYKKKHHAKKHHAKKAKSILNSMETKNPDYLVAEVSEKIVEKVASHEKEGDNHNVFSPGIKISREDLYYYHFAGTEYKETIMKNLVESKGMAYESTETGSIAIYVPEEPREDTLGYHIKKIAEIEEEQE